MEIELVWGSAEGETPLSAFDAALAAAGIHDYNLVTYSSVVPADATVREVGTHDGRFDVGAPVGAVLAENVSAVANTTVVAGLGWATAAEGGVFYEATADSVSNCRDLLSSGLAEARSLRDWDWDGDAQFRFCEHAVEGTGAAVVAAVYGPLAYDDGLV